MVCGVVTSPSSGVFWTVQCFGSSTLTSRYHFKSLTTGSALLNKPEVKYLISSAQYYSHRSPTPFKPYRLVEVFMKSNRMDDSPRSLIDRRSDRSKCRYCVPALQCVILSDNIGGLKFEKVFSWERMGNIQNSCLFLS